MPASQRSILPTDLPLLHATQALSKLPAWTLSTLGRTHKARGTPLGPRTQPPKYTPPEARPAGPPEPVAEAPKPVAPDQRPPLPHVDKNLTFCRPASEARTHPATAAQAFWLPRNRATRGRTVFLVTLNIWALMGNEDGSGRSTIPLRGVLPRLC